ncbi:MAG: ice-binding family protein [Minisyncoccota bacterium]
MKKINSISAITLAVFFVFGLNGPVTVSAATTPSLGDAATYGVLSDTYTNTNVPNPTTINGDVGFTIAPAVIPLGAHPNYGSGVPYATAGTAQATALASLNGEGCDFTFVAPAVVLDATVEHVSTYGPGVYCSTGAMSVGTAGGITLSGAGTYIFRSGGALDTVANSTVNLGPGASACDVFWTPAGATTLNANSTFIGTVIPTAAPWDITILDATSWIGRALAFGHSVTTPDANVTITAPSCAPAPATFTVTKVVINNDGGIKVVADFPLFVNATPVVSGVANIFVAGAYAVTETTDVNYAQTFSGDCDASGNINLTSGSTMICTVTNDDIVVPVPVVSSINTSGSSHQPRVSLPTTAPITPIQGQVLGVQTSVPGLPNAGFPPRGQNTPNNTIVFGFLALIGASLVVISRKQTS